MEIKGRDFSLLPKAVFTAEPGTAESVTAAQHTPCSGLALAAPRPHRLATATAAWLSGQLESHASTCSCFSGALRVMNTQNVGFPFVMVNLTDLPGLPGAHVVAQT